MSSDHPPQHAAEPEQHGRHELPPDEPAPEIGELHGGGLKGVMRRGRSQLMFGALAVLLCVVLGMAIVTQARQTESGDSLETARPADLLVLLDSLQQRKQVEKALSEVRPALEALEKQINDPKVEPAGK